MIKNIFPLLILSIFFLSAIIPALGQARQSYIQCIISSISDSAITITDTTGQSQTINLSHQAVFYDCSKSYGPASRSTLKEIAPNSSAVISVQNSSTGGYSATGIIFLPQGNQLDPTWQKKMEGYSPQVPNQTTGQQNSSPQVSNTNGFTQPFEGQNVQQETAAGGDMPHSEGLVTAINSTSVTLQTLKGQVVTGTVTPETMIYDLSTKYSMDPTGQFSNIRPGDIITVSYEKTSTAVPVISVIMYLPQGKQFDETWKQMYEQIKQGNP